MKARRGVPMPRGTPNGSSNTVLPPADCLCASGWRGGGPFLISLPSTIEGCRVSAARGFGSNTACHACVRAAGFQWGHIITPAAKTPGSSTSLLAGCPEAVRRHRPYSLALIPSRGPALLSRAGPHVTGTGELLGQLSPADDGAPLPAPCPAQPCTPKTIPIGLYRSQGPLTKCHPLLLPPAGRYHQLKHMAGCRRSRRQDHLPCLNKLGGKTGTGLNLSLSDWGVRTPRKDE